jgi:hypothetical protein
VTPYDELLMWASEKQAGSLETLQRACQWIGLRVGVRWRDLQDDMLALAHVDVIGSRWFVAPPHLSRLADGGGNALFVGARPGWLVDAVEGLEKAPSSSLQALADFVYENHRVEQKGPASWYFAAGAGAPWEAFDELGIRVVDDLAGAMMVRAAAVSRGRVKRTVRPGELVSRLVDGSFAAGQLEWRTVRGDDDPGLYLYLRNNQRVYAERTAEDWRETDLRWGTWRHGGRKKIWSVMRRRRLYVPSTLRLPLEVERSLHLRSGRLPQRDVLPEITGSDKPVLCFENVTNEVAATTARLVHAHLELK